MLTLKMRCSTLVDMKISRTGDAMRGGIGKKKYQRVGNVAALSKMSGPMKKKSDFVKFGTARN